jgi:hypothetical protein
MTPDPRAMHVARALIMASEYDQKVYEQNKYVSIWKKKQETL